MAVQTILADARRAATSVAITARPSVSGYVRMLNPPSCSRCAVLAGRWYRWNEGFERHPRCDCLHIPAEEADATDLRVNPALYFESLDERDQERIFTVAGARAVRDGADIGQVVNARRGMRTAQLFGQDLLVTTEGTTRRGGASRARTGRKGPRLMPESIYSVATDRADAIRLLRVNGYLT